MYIVKIGGREFGPRVCYEGEGAGGGTAAAGAGGQAKPENQGGQSGSTTNNNNGAFSLDAPNIWATPQPNQGGNTTTQPTVIVQPPQQQQTPQQQFEAYVNSRDFGFNMGQDDIQKFVSAGDTAGLAAAVNTSLRNVYKQAMLDSSRMVNDSVDRAVAQAVEKATGMYKGDQNKQVLEQMVPIAKNPNVAPVANAVHKQFMKSGLNAQQAAEKVQQFFGSLQGQNPTNFGLPPSSGSGKNGFGQNMNGGFGDDDQEIDWMSFAGSGS